MWKYTFVEIHICGNTETHKHGNVKMSKFLAIKKPNADNRLQTMVDKTTDEGTKRLSLDLPTAMHKALKQASLERGMTMRDLLLEALHRDLQNDRT
jgi:hypothetical protein